MPRSPIPPLALFLAVLAAVVLASCGGADREQASTGAGSPDPRPEGDGGPQQAAPKPRIARAPVPVHPGRASRELLAAARASEREPRAFTTELEVDAPGAPTLRATLVGSGRRGATSATATGSGLTRAFVAGWRLAVRDDRLFVDAALASTAAAGGWRDLGSASGVQLDVGRELLTHPMLTRVVWARRSGGELRVRVVVPAAALRAYAGDERAGPVTDLLVRARELQVDATVRHGRVTSDRFVLVVTSADGPTAPQTRIEGSTTTRFGGKRVEPVGPPRGAAVPSGSIVELFPSGSAAP